MVLAAGILQGLLWEPGDESSGPPSHSKLLTLQWVSREGVLQRPPRTSELPYSTGKTYYRKAANSRGKLLPTFSTCVMDSGESTCFGQIPKMLFGVYPKQDCIEFSYP